VIPNKQLKAPWIPGIDVRKIICAHDFKNPLSKDILKVFDGVDAG
jgi:hypothetical protein